MRGRKSSERDVSRSGRSGGRNVAGGGGLTDGSPSVRMKKCQKKDSVTLDWNGSATKGESVEGSNERRITIEVGHALRNAGAGW